MGSDFKIRCDDCGAEADVRSVYITAPGDHQITWLWKAPPGWKAETNGEALCPACAPGLRRTDAPLVARIRELEKENAELSEKVANMWAAAVREDVSAADPIATARDASAKLAEQEATEIIAMESRLLLARVPARSEEWFAAERPETYRFAVEALTMNPNGWREKTREGVALQVYGIPWLLLLSIMLSVIQILIRCWDAFEGEEVENYITYTYTGKTNRNVRRITRLIKIEARRHRRRMSWEKARVLANRLLTDISAAPPVTISAICAEWYEGDAIGEDHNVDANATD